LPRRRKPPAIYIPAEPPSGAPVGRPRIYEEGTVRVSLALRAKVIEGVDMLAKRYNMSRNMMINILLGRAIDDRLKHKEPIDQLAELEMKLMEKEQRIRKLEAEVRELRERLAQLYTIPMSYVKSTSEYKKAVMDFLNAWHRGEPMPVLKSKMLKRASAIARKLQLPYKWRWSILKALEEDVLEVREGG